MARALAGKLIAFLVANDGVEQAELTGPWQAVEQDGGRPVLIAPGPGSVQGYTGRTPAAHFPVHLTVDEVSVDDYVGLVLPGGVVNADQLRVKPSAVALVREFVDGGKPVAAICHAGWILIEAGAVPGKTMTSFPSLRTDLENAGASWVDEVVHVDNSAGWTLVTSRIPDDLPEFCREACRAFAA